MAFTVNVFKDLLLAPNVTAEQLNKANSELLNSISEMTISILVMFVTAPGSLLARVLNKWTSW